MQFFCMIVVSNKFKIHNIKPSVLISCGSDKLSAVKTVSTYRLFREQVSRKHRFVKTLSQRFRT